MREEASKAGRRAAQQAVARCADVEAAQVEIRHASDGAPEAWFEGHRLPVSVSISHRAGVAIAAATPDGFNVGCDVELIEPRCSTFPQDWFTARELRAVEHAAPDDRDPLITLIWSAKESVLKVLRTGLRLDTRQVEISVSDGSFDAAVNCSRMSGWWKRDGHFVITAVAQERLR